jgi:hypothetical protein
LPRKALDTRNIIVSIAVLASSLTGTRTKAKTTEMMKMTTYESFSIDCFDLRNFTALNEIEFTTELFLSDDKVAGVFALKDNAEKLRFDVEYALANRGIMSYEWTSDTMRVLTISMLEANIRSELNNKQEKYNVQFVPIVDLLVLLLVREVEAGEKYRNRMAEMVRICKEIMR